MNVRNPTIGLFGYGAFGKLIYDHIHNAYEVKVSDPIALQNDDSVVGSELSEVASADIVVLAVPVQNLAGVCRDIRPHLKKGALVLDVGSVKVVPEEILSHELPDTVDIVGTHPLFGPETIKSSKTGLKIVVCPIRVKDRTLKRLIAWMYSHHLNVYQATSHEHDQELATVQGITHLVAKALKLFEPLPTDMTTRSFDLLRNACSLVQNDSDSVYDAIERLNPYSSSIRAKFINNLRRLDNEETPFERLGTVLIVHRNPTVDARLVRLAATAKCFGDRVIVAVPNKLRDISDSIEIIECLRNVSKVFLYRDLHDVKEEIISSDIDTIICDAESDFEIEAFSQICTVMPVNTATMKPQQKRARFG